MEEEAEELSCVAGAGGSEVAKGEREEDKKVAGLAGRNILGWSCEGVEREWMMRGRGSGKEAGGVEKESRKLERSGDEVEGLKRE